MIFVALLASLSVVLSLTYKNHLRNSQSEEEDKALCETKLNLAMRFSIKGKVDDKKCIFTVYNGSDPVEHPVEVSIPFYRGEKQLKRLILVSLGLNTDLLMNEKSQYVDEK